MTDPHFPAQVVAFDGAVQPQTPVSPLPPQVTPVPLHATQAVPPVPQAASAVPARHVPPSQQPAQRAVQSTASPQVFSTVPHSPAQVVASASAVQPHAPGVPPPPQVWPGPVHATHASPPVPQARVAVPGWQVAPSQQPLPSQTLEQVPFS